MFFKRIPTPGQHPMFRAVLLIMPSLSLEPRSHEPEVFLDPVGTVGHMVHEGRIFCCRTVHGRQIGATEIKVAKMRFARVEVAGDHHPRFFFQSGHAVAELRDREKAVFSFTCLLQMRKAVNVLLKQVQILGQVGVETVITGKNRGHIDRLIIVRQDGVR